MGSDHHYPEEAPAHRVSVNSFWIDGAPVTNAEFRRFVEATNYVTFAELAPKASDYPRVAAHAEGRIARLQTPCWQGKSISGIGDSGGSFASGRIGAALTEEEAGSRDLTNIPSFMSPIAMRRPTRSGLERNCRPRRNGSTQPGAVSTEPNSHGATS